MSARTYGSDSLAALQTCFNIWWKETCPFLLPVQWSVTLVRRRLSDMHRNAYCSNCWKL